jgi:hypothetical protein
MHVAPQKQVLEGSTGTVVHRSEACLTVLSTSTILCLVACVHEEVSLVENLSACYSIFAFSGVAFYHKKGETAWSNDATSTSMFPDRVADEALR